MTNVLSSDLVGHVSTGNIINNRTFFYTIHAVNRCECLPKTYRMLNWTLWCKRAIVRSHIFHHRSKIANSIKKIDIWIFFGCVMNIVNLSRNHIFMNEYPCPLLTSEMLQLNCFYSSWIEVVIFRLYFASLDLKTKNNFEQKNNLFFHYLFTILFIQKQNKQRCLSWCKNGKKIN